MQADDPRGISTKPADGSTVSGTARPPTGPVASTARPVGTPGKAAGTRRMIDVGRPLRPAGCPGPSGCIRSSFDGLAGESASALAGFRRPPADRSAGRGAGSSHRTASGVRGREPIEIILVQDAETVQHDPHIGEVVRSYGGIGPVGGEYEREVSPLVPESDPRLGDGISSNPSSNKIRRRAENLRPGAGIMMRGAGICNPLDLGLDGVLAPDDLSDRSSVQAITQPKITFTVSPITNDTGGGWLAK